MKLKAIHVWDDKNTPRSGPENMRIDEEMFERYREDNVPQLRFYCWDGEWWSVGYFQRSIFTDFQSEGKKVVRRRTGGGVVRHDSCEETYCLILPENCAVVGLAAPEIYEFVHQALAQAIVECGGDATLSGPIKSKEPGFCFEEPVKADVVNPVSGEKLAGAAQRRSRRAVLHQGSVRLPVEFQGKWQNHFVANLADSSVFKENVLSF